MVAVDSSKELKLYLNVVVKILHEKWLLGNIHTEVNFAE